MPIQLLPSNLIFRFPRHVNGMSRCVHTLARLDVYIYHIKVILLVVTGWVMPVIAQWYNCSIISFVFLENKAKKPIKTTGTKFKFQYLKRTPLQRTVLQFIRTSKYLPLQSYKALDQKILQQRLLPKISFTGSDLNNNHL